MAPARVGSQSARSPAPVPPLPQPSFRKIQGEDVNEPAGVNDPSSRCYGYNDFSLFSRPDHYIRYIEPIESELTNQVEYDMDEQDQEWLDLVNEERKKAQVGTISPEIFEIMMDRLEKEWFELMKRVPKLDMGLPSEDSTCAICDDGEGENSNAIVFCDGCNLAVHQDCYGVPYIPEGQWLCRKCTVSPEVPVPCVFCPNEGGAFKQTTSGQWAHLLCAMFIPEVTVGNMLWMEPIDNVEKVPKSRWKLTCSLCKIKHGACIQCDKNICFAAFHVTCARRAKLLMGMKGLAGDDASYKGYCEKHLPEDVKKTRGEVGDISEGPLTVNGRAPKSSKSARAYSKKYSLGPPLVPQLIADKLETYYKKHFRNKSQFIQLICKYWSLKREARRGAPLLKRLHLEPWTASTVSRQQTEQEKSLKLQYLIRLRTDLEKVRMLAELTRKREQQKLNQAKILDDIIAKVLFPHERVLRLAFEQIQNHDKNELFQRPVTRAEAPDYFDVIKNPMSFTTIDAKLDKGEYLDSESFKSDVNLVFDNAMLYNKRDTVFHKAAARLKVSATHILASLDSLVAPEGGDCKDTSLEPWDVGNLEANVENLKLLLSEESIKNDMNLIIGTEPITSLFRIEYGKLKPPPPRPSLKPKKERPKRDYKVERERRKRVQASLAAENALLLDASPGFRAPRATRSTKAAMDAAIAALEAEFAAGTSQSSASHENHAKAAHLPPRSQDAHGEQHTLITAIKPETPTPGLPKRPRSWRREHVLLPGQGGPNMVESMDNQGSFKNFDRGWILPSGSRRHGRAVPDPPAARDVLPPKKRARTDHAKSRLSVVSTDPADNMTLQSDSWPEAAEGINGPSTTANTVVLMDVDQPIVNSPRLSADEPSLADAPTEYFAPMRLTRSYGSTTGASSSSRAILPEPASSSGVKLERNETHSSQPSESNAAEEEGVSQPFESSFVPGRTLHKRSKHPQQALTTPKAKAPGPQQGMITLQEGEMVSGGTLVWAKMDSYPWWAAVVWEEDDKAVPMNVLRSKSSIPRTEPGPLTLVQFYDKARSWQWLELSCLRYLGEDKELDSLLLSGRGKVQTFRTPRLRQGCRGAYRQAIAEMEEPEGETNEGATNTSVNPSASVEPIFKTETSVSDQRAEPPLPQLSGKPSEESFPSRPVIVTQMSLSASSRDPEHKQDPTDCVGTKDGPLANPGKQEVTPAPTTENLAAAQKVVRPPSSMSSELSELEPE